MRDCDFDVQVSWSGMGRSGKGLIGTADAMQEISGPEPMSGKGTRTSPEELLVAAVALSYTLALSGVLSRAQLPVGRLVVSARGMVRGTPADARFERIVVSPTILEGDTTRRDEYAQAALLARQRSFLGATLSAEVACEVGPLGILPLEAARPLSTTRNGRAVPGARRSRAGRESGLSDPSPAAVRTDRPPAATVTPAKAVSAPR